MAMRMAKVIDKTRFIQDFMTCGSQVPCILRPQGFGKSTNLNMLKAFLSLGASRQDFEGLEIGKNTEIMAKHCGQYPVIHLDLTDCEGSSWEEMYRLVWLRLTRMILRHEMGLKDFVSLLQRHGMDPTSPIAQGTPEAASALLWMLMDALHKKHGKVILLIDEFDAPLNSAAQNGFYAEASKFFGALFSSALKNNPSLDKACLFGSVELVHGSTPLGMDALDLDVYTIRTETFSEHFGFTEKEVSEFLGSQEKSQTEEIVRWCGGYRSGPHSLIHPRSFMEYVKEKEFTLSRATSVTIGTLAKVLIDSSGSGLTDLLPRLEQGKDMPVSPLRTHLQYRDIESDWNAALHYLTLKGFLAMAKTKAPYDPSDSYKLTVQIPNEQMRQVWRAGIVAFLNDKKVFNDEFRGQLKNVLLKPSFKKTELREVLTSLSDLCLSHSLIREESVNMGIFFALRATFPNDPNVKIASEYNLYEEYYYTTLQFIDERTVFIFMFQINGTAEDLKHRASDDLRQNFKVSYDKEFKKSTRYLLGVSFYKKKVSRIEMMDPKTLDLE